MVQGSFPQTIGKPNLRILKIAMSPLHGMPQKNTPSNAQVSGVCSSYTQHICLSSFLIPPLVWPMGVDEIAKTNMAITNRL